MDCFGPWYIKERRSQVKRYGVIFVCLMSKAVHLEIVNSMDTDSFLNAYRRFVCRRGPIRQLRCDCGSNFIGARNELTEQLNNMDKDLIAHELLKDKVDFVEFKLNVPHASHMVGIWERNIRTVRSILSTLLYNHGKQLDDESLRTFMVEVEAIMNSRPITSINTNPTDAPEPLTPNHLLTMKSNVTLPPPGVFQMSDMYLRKRWRRVQYLTSEFWNQWRKYHLQTLQERQKWSKSHRNIQINDVVILKDENVARNEWKLARVVETYPGNDGLVRKVKLVIGDRMLDDKGKRRSRTVYVERPIHKLVLLLMTE
ncbi:Uncharacterised protein r2_g2573 [Pycnogonum litorale]